VCPTHLTARPFFCEPVLDAWRRGQSPGKFLEDVCRMGIRLLHEYEETLQILASTLPPGENGPASKMAVSPRDELHFFLPLFRIRLAGRIGVTRRFARADDFFGLNGRRGGEGCIVPGFSLRPSKEGHFRSSTALIEEVQRSAVTPEPGKAKAGDGR